MNKWKHPEKDKYILRGTTSNITITPTTDKSGWTILFQPINTQEDSDFYLHVSNLQYAQRIAVLIDGGDGRF